MKADGYVVDTTALLDEICKILPQAGTVPLRISGNSMVPFLVHGRDTVYLSPVTRPLRRGDMVLYQRCNGTYILHRIAGQKNGQYYMVGDAQTMLEPGILPQQIHGMVVAVDRKGRREKPGSFWWEFFEKIWIRLVPFRPLLFKGYGFIRILTGKKE